MGRALFRTSAVFAFAFLCVLGTLWLRGFAHAENPVATKLMDGHMEITLRRLPAAGDAERAAAIVAAAKRLVVQYADVTDAERDGYKKFLPGIRLPEEHFTNSQNALAAQFGSFDPNRPTSLIYHRSGDMLTIAGVMYTAPNRFSEAQLDERVPLSVGTWHRHVDFCVAPAGTSRERDAGLHPRFGIDGSLDTRTACEAAGGTFIPRVFGWMIHVWPNAATAAAIWSIHGTASGGMVAMHDDHMGAGAGMAPDAALPIPLDHLPALPLPAGRSARGATLFAQNCASCHGSGGRNGPDAPALAARGLAAGQVAFMVRNPQAIDVSSEMPRLPLSDADVADVAAYVSQLK